MSLTLQELCRQARDELNKLAKRDADKPMSGMLAQWSWELSAKFKAPLLAMLVPHWPGTALIVIPLPAAPADSLGELKAKLEADAVHEKGEGT